jgi:CO/xanthine dehydrogenase FAD-binding subunit
MLYNVREYHRPTEIADALRLIQRSDIRTVPIGGGTSIVGEGTSEIEAVVDLSELGLNFIKREGQLLRLGSTVRLQTIVEDLTDIASGLLSDTARRMAGWNMRNASTIGGSLAGGDVHSPLSVMLAALDARVTILDTDGESIITWEDLAESLPLRGKLITAVTVDVQPQSAAAYEQVGRTPADRAIVSAAAVIRPATDDQMGMVVVIGGLLDKLVVLRQPSADAPIADFVADIDAGPDTSYQSNYLGSAEYRRSIAPILAQRALDHAKTLYG